MIFGGHRVDDVGLNDICVLTLAGSPTWSQLVTAGTPPPPQSNHNAAYDPVFDRMVLVGGYDWYYFGDVWSCSLASEVWSQLVVSHGVPDARIDCAAHSTPIAIASVSTAERDPREVREVRLVSTARSAMSE